MKKIVTFLTPFLFCQLATAALPINIQGTWTLSGINCNGYESILIPNANLGTGASSTVILGAESGHRNWTWMGCTQDIEMSTLSRSAKKRGTLYITDEAASCSGQCQGISACSGTGASYSLSYSGSSPTLTFTVPPQEEYLNICLGRSDSVVELQYTLSTAAVDADGDEYSYGTYGNDPDDGDPCNPDDQTYACGETIDEDSDGYNRNDDPDDYDPCNPDDQTYECGEITDADDDGYNRNVDPDDNDYCNPDTQNCEKGVKKPKKK